MSTNFNRFLYMYHHGQLEQDVTWRAYNIVGSVKAQHVKLALKALGLEYAGELALSHFQSLYEVPDRNEAEGLLGGWWIWNELSRGRRMRVPYRSTRAAVSPAETPSYPA